MVIINCSEKGFGAMVKNVGYNSSIAVGHGTTKGFPGEPYKHPATQVVAIFGFPPSSICSRVNPVPSASVGQGALSLYRTLYFINPLGVYNRTPSPPLAK